MLPSLLGFFAQVALRMKHAADKRANADLQPSISLAVPKWRIPMRTSMNVRLIGGMLLFGLAWGATVHLTCLEQACTLC